MLSMKHCFYYHQKIYYYLQSSLYDVSDSKKELQASQAGCQKHHLVLICCSFCTAIFFLLNHAIRITNQMGKIVICLNAPFLSLFQKVAPIWLEFKLYYSVGRTLFVSIQESSKSMVRVRMMDLQLTKLHGQTNRSIER